MGHGKSNSKREIHSTASLLQITRKISNKPSNLKEQEKEQQTKPRVEGSK